MRDLFIKTEQKYTSACARNYKAHVAKLLSQAGLASPAALSVVPPPPPDEDGLHQLMKGLNGGNSPMLAPQKATGDLPAALLARSVSAPAELHASTPPVARDAQPTTSTAAGAAEDDSSKQPATPVEPPKPKLQMANFGKGTSDPSASKLKAPSFGGGGARKFGSKPLGARKLGAPAVKLSAVPGEQSAAIAAAATSE